MRLVVGGYYRLLFILQWGGVSSNPTVFLHTAVLPCHAFVVRAKIKSRRDGSENEVEFEFENEVELR